MAATDQRRTVLELVNEVLKKQFLNTVTALTDTKQSGVLLQLLNEVVADANDHGDWQEMFAEVVVSASPAQFNYGLGLDSPVQNILEISVSGQPAPLLYQDIREMRRLIRVGTTGTPRHFTLIGTDSQENPKFEVSPIPSTAAASAAFTVLYYKKPAMFTTSDAAVTPDFPANMLIQGLYAMAILHENGGERTREFDAEFTKYEKIRGQALNRYTVDTGNEIYFVPDSQPGVR